MRTAQIDADAVNYRLTEAGRTLLSLPGRSDGRPNLGIRTSSLPYATEITLMASYAPAMAIRPAAPSSQAISRMDEAFAWLSYIPQSSYVLRRIVAARCLVSPTTDKHLFPWRRLGTAIGADYHAVQRWHAQGVGIIVAALLRHGDETAELVGMRRALDRIGRKAPRNVLDAA